jgi:GT2 family glycosyltransferase
MPLLSIIVPTWNRAMYLATCVASFRAQTDRHDCELVIVDDGSTDDTPALVDMLCSADPSIRYVRQDNRGAAAARNSGARAASGEWLAFLDSDDLYFDNTVRAFKHHLRSLPVGPRAVDIVCGRLFTSNERLASASGAASARVVDVFARTLGFSSVGLAVLLQNSVFRRALYEAVGGFREDLRTSEDRDFLIRATASSAAMCFNEVVAYYRTDHGVGKSEEHLRSGGKVQAHRAIITALLRHPTLVARFERNGGVAEWERMVQAYLAMLNVADAIRAQNGGVVRDESERMAGLCASEDEVASLLRKLALFFRHPLHLPAIAALHRTGALLTVAEHVGTRSLVGRLARADAEKIAERSALAQAEPHDRIRGLEPTADAAPAVESEAPELYRVLPHSILPLPGGRVLLRAGPDSSMIVDRPIRDAVASWTRFSSVEGRVKECVCQGRIAPEQQDALRAALDVARRSGMLLSSTRLLREGAEPPSRRPLRRLAVVIDRLDCRAVVRALGRALGGLSSDGGLEVVIADLRSDAGPGVEVRKAFAPLRAKHGFDFRYLDRERWERFARLLVSQAGRDCGVASEQVTSVRRALSASPWNALLLDGAGHATLILEEGAAPSLPCRRDGELLRLMSRVPLWTARHPGRQLPPSAGPTPNLVAAHSRYLGAGLSDCVRIHHKVETDDDPATFLATSSGGEPFVAATVASCHGPRLRSAWQAQLRERAGADCRDYIDDASFLDALDEPAAWRGVGATTIATGGRLQLGAMAFASGATSMPPFPMVPDDLAAELAGTILSLTHDDARVAYLPDTVALGDGAAPGDRYLPEVAALQAGLRTYRRRLWVTGFAESLRDLGAHLQGFSGQRGGDFSEIVGSVVLEQAGTEIAHLDQVARFYDRRPLPWAQLIDRRLAELEEKIVGGCAMEPQATESSRALARDYGALLYAWPALARVAEALRAEGVRCSESLQ